VRSKKQNAWTGSREPAMGLTTDISWCDSTANGEMGCDGCELWLPEQGKRQNEILAIVSGRMQAVTVN